MATYTLTIDLSEQSFPTEYMVMHWSQTCIEQWNQIDSIEDFTQIIVNYIEGFDGTCSYSINGNLVTFTANVDYCNGPVYIAFENVLAPWIPSITTPCPNCQPIAITNCGPVEISLPIPDDDYTVTLYDNHSGVSYEQNVQWTAGTGTWNTTNTAGVFTPFNIFTLTVTDSSGEPVSWPVGPNEYTCARVTFSATVDTNVND